MGRNGRIDIKVGFVGGKLIIGRMIAILMVLAISVIVSAEESCVSFGRCGFVMNDETGYLENTTRCEKNYELLSNCSCVYKKGSGCRFNSGFMNIGSLKNVYNCLKPVTRCQTGSRCGYLFYGNLKFGKVECPEGYVLNGNCGCEKRSSKRENERCQFYKTPVNMFANDNTSILVEMVDCRLLMDTIDLPEGLQLDWKLTPEESELVVAYNVVNEMNSYFSENFVYVFGECGNGEWELNFGGGRRVSGRVKRGTRWSAEGNLRISSECNGQSGEAGRVSVNSIRKAASERCKKELNSMKQKMRKECDNKTKASKNRDFCGKESDKRMRGKSKRNAEGDGKNEKRFGREKAECDEAAGIGE